MADSPLHQALQSLNPKQKEAATHIDGALLILAGAGSGKTKTLTTRLAYLINEVGIPPSATLTLTFTNKAAQEMRDRALSLLSNAYQAPPLLCTFHKFGLLFLRFYIKVLEREANFVVLDSDDKKAILKSLSKALPVSQFDSYISNMKNSTLSPQEAAPYAHSPEHKLMNRIYAEYEEYIQKKNLLDFDDLLYLTYKILSQRSDIAKEMSQRYQYIMVDEYQDTNELQYKILKLLCTTHNNLCVVGDDDQSIYGWRGADIGNILRFAKEFSGATTIKLEENYRSSEEILQAANALIAHNTERLGKNLKSVKGSIQAVRVIENDDEAQEATFLAKEIAKLCESGENPSDIAILFRVNALSRSIEESFNRFKIPYKLIGAVRFYERAEIKDLLSYLRLIVNPNDDFSFLRIINRPKRGIGKVTQSKLEQLSQSKGLSCLACLEQYPLESKAHIGEKAYTALVKLQKDLSKWRDMADLSEMIEDMQENLIFEFSPLDEVDREGNIYEFYGMFKDYVIHNPTNTLDEFLNDLALASPSDETVGDCVSCMSVHSAKGLEFKHIYVIGFEEGFFPLHRGENDEIEEERRLGYVAFTRAKEHLNLCYSKSRLYRGKREWQLRQSRFLKESGLGEGAESLRDSAALESSDDKIEIGSQVVHKIFGVGSVESMEGKGEQCKLRINFGGMRRVILRSFVEKLN
ncbi:DNA helicase [Helicobacter cinaedi]|uniref:ATP-dependent helicase n=1 Tax=Helicobacter cinaedi TaxID=213 RepID=UPI001EEE5373|nr:UvrD-helicase domain-containing protein [Helicobacter cinaedi]BDB64446.1 DNA helicase [Helicobacter cinaedi]